MSEYVCESCGTQLVSESAECDNCSSGTQSVPYKNSEIKQKQNKGFPFAGLTFLFSIFAWLVMLVGSADSSMKMEGNLNYLSLRHPLLNDQIIYHRYGLWLAIASLIFGFIGIVKDHKSRLTRLSFILGLVYVVTHI